MIPHTEIPASAPRSGFASFLPAVADIRIRPIRPSDEAACRLFGTQLSAEDLRLRFASAVRPSGALYHRLIENDASRDAVLLALDEDDAVLGIGRLARVSGDAAEFALLVRSDLKGRGIGRRLLVTLIGHSRAIGCRAVFGDILYENMRMRRLAASLGFRADGDTGLMIRMRLDLCPFPF